MPTFKTGPSILIAPWKALTTTYGIEDGYVYVDRRLLFIPFGQRPRIHLSKVTRYYPEGSFFGGSVVFGEGSHNPVRWDNLLNPDGKYTEAKRVIEGFSSDQQRELENQSIQSKLAERLVLVPPIDDGFEAIAWKQSNGGVNHSVNVGEIVRAGETVATLNLEVSWLQTLRLEFAAPVTGRVIALSATGDLDRYIAEPTTNLNNRAGYSMVIQTTQEESAPKDTSKCFSDFDLFFRHVDRIMKDYPSEYKEGMSRRAKLQTQAPLIVFHPDESEDPIWREQLDFLSGV